RPPPSSPSPPPPPRSRRKVSSPRRPQIAYSGRCTWPLSFLVDQFEFDPLGNYPRRAEDTKRRVDWQLASIRATDKSKMFNPHCCSFYSATGIIFMIFVWAMLSTQPFFITGIEDVEQAKSNAFGALMTFCGLFVVSTAIMMKENGSGREYDTGDENYNKLNIDLKKEYGEGQNYGSVATDSY
ncbi:hypothetical protein ACHAWF_013968, partial [Thalassiosira exigua]